MPPMNCEDVRSPLSGFTFPSKQALFPGSLPFCALKLAPVVNEDGLEVFPAVFYKFMPDPMWSHAIHPINLLRRFVIK